MMWKSSLGQWKCSQDLCFPSHFCINNLEQPFTSVNNTLWETQKFTQAEREDDCPSLTWDLDDQGLLRTLFPPFPCFSAPSYFLLSKTLCSHPPINVTSYFLWLAFSLDFLPHKPTGPSLASVDSLDMNHYPLSPLGNIFAPKSL